MRSLTLTVAILAISASSLLAVVPVSVVAVPEPGFYPELVLALSGLVLYARSRRK